MVLVSVRYLFYQPINEKIKTWALCFPAKENPNMGGHCSTFSLLCFLPLSPNLLQLLFDIKNKREYSETSIQRTPSGPFQVSP